LVLCQFFLILSPCHESRKRFVPFVCSKVFASIPEGVEEEEDLGEVEHDEEGDELARPSDQEEFLVEVNQEENAIAEDEEELEEELEEEHEESEDETPPTLPPKVVMNRSGRKITPSAMIGEVQKGKYSASISVERSEAKKDTKRKRK